MSVSRPSSLGVSAFIAWLAMDVVAIAAWGIGYVRGTIRDPDILNIAEAMMMPALFMTLPFGIYALGMLWPCMRVIEAVTRGRLSRIVYVLIGGVLTAPLLVAFIAGGRLLWPGPTTVLQHVSSIVQNKHGDGWLLLCFVVGGLIVGAGAGTRATSSDPESSALPSQA